MNAESGWGAFNGQTGRQAIVEETLKKLQITTFVETGTYLGETTEWAAQTGLRVFTVEVDERRREMLERKMEPFERVVWRLGDSRQFLNDLISEAACPLQRVLFYLDAHWFQDLPLRQEVDLIIANWRRSVIVIDDFRVPDDEGYGFDDYPGVGALTPSLLRPLPLTYFWPQMASSDENGAKRGCAVIAWEEVMVRELEKVDRLRREEVS